MRDSPRLLLHSMGLLIEYRRPFSLQQNLSHFLQNLSSLKHQNISLLILSYIYLKQFYQKQDCEVEEALQRKADDAAIAQVIVATIAIVAINATNVFINLRPG